MVVGKIEQLTTAHDANDLRDQLGLPVNWPELAALRAENKRFREALQIIADEDWIKHGGVKVYQRWGGIAAKALKGEQPR